VVQAFTNHAHGRGFFAGATPLPAGTKTPESIEYDGSIVFFIARYPMGDKPDFNGGSATGTEQLCRVFQDRVAGSDWDALDCNFGPRYRA